MFELLSVIVFVWLLIKAISLALKLTWGMAKIIAGISPQETDDAQWAKRENGKPVSIWIDKDNLVISFKKVEGFEERIFPDHDKMMETVFHMGSSGYRFQ